MPAGLNTWSDHLLLKSVNVAAFLFFFGSGLYNALTPNGNYGGKETYITPSAWTFGIWTVIDLLLLGYVVYQFFDTSHDAIHGVGWRFALVAVLNSIFIHTYVTGHHIVSFIFSVFVASTVSTVYYSLNKHYPAQTLPDTLFVHLPFSLWHAWSIVTMILSGFAAFTSGIHPSRGAGVTVTVLVVVAEAFLGLTAVGYAFQSRKGDVAGAAVIAYTLFGIYDHQHSTLIRYFALGSFVVSSIAIVKSVFFTFGKGGDGQIALGDDENTPLIA